MRKLLTSPIALLFIVLIGFGIFYFGISYFAVQHSSHMSPDGNYTIEIYQYPVVGAFFGNINDGPGYLIFKDNSTNSNERRPIGLISITDSVVWSFDSVNLGMDLSFPLNDTYPIQPGHLESYSKQYLEPALESGNVDRVIKVLKKGCNIQGYGPFAHAVSKKDTAMLNLLLEQPGYLDLLNSLPQNALNDTTVLGDVSLVEFLIEKGLNTNFKKRGGESPLIAAMLGHHSKTIIMFLKRKLNSSCYTGRSRALFEETEKWYQRLIQRMLKRNDIRCWAFEKKT
ncbi:MAG: hypothetical protein OCD01_15130 [Fibrobacterales bacterium]